MHFKGKKVHLPCLLGTLFWPERSELHWSIYSTLIVKLLPTTYNSFMGRNPCRASTGHWGSYHTVTYDLQQTYQNYRKSKSEQGSPTIVSSFSEPRPLQQSATEASDQAILKKMSSSENCIFKVGVAFLYFKYRLVHSIHQTFCFHWLRLHDQTKCPWHTFVQQLPSAVQMLLS